MLKDAEIRIYRLSGLHLEGVGQGVGHIKPAHREGQQLPLQVRQTAYVGHFARDIEGLQSRDEFDLVLGGAHGPDGKNDAALDLFGTEGLGQELFQAVHLDANMDRLKAFIQAEDFLDDLVRLVKLAFAFVDREVAAPPVPGRVPGS